MRNERRPRSNGLAADDDHPVARRHVTAQCGEAIHDVGLVPADDVPGMRGPGTGRHDDLVVAADPDSSGVRLTTELDLHPELFQLPRLPCHVLAPLRTVRRASRQQQLPTERCSALPERHVVPGEGRS